MYAMSAMKFTFHFLPIEDRVVWVFQESQQTIPNLLLSRRLVKMMSVHLRRLLESPIDIPEDVDRIQKQHAIEFAHESMLQQAVVSEEKNEQVPVDIKKLAFPTRIHFQPQQTKTTLSFYRASKHIMSLSVDQTTLHRIFHALAHICQKADWDLEMVFAWCSTEESPDDGRGRYVC